MQENKNTCSGELLKILKQKGTPEKAAVLSGFFKTGKGQYGEGDKFLGIPVPEIRKIIRSFHSIPVPDLFTVLHSEWHEVREAAVFLLVWHYGHSDRKQCEYIFDNYLANTAYINNWDLVDLSCPHIVGKHLLDRDRKILFSLAESSLLWERRISMVSCLAFIRRGENKTAYQIAEKLLGDREDLMHKAVGWMLRETGKYCNEAELVFFLEKHYAELPRTALRYAIERFPEERRRKMLKGIF